MTGAAQAAPPPGVLDGDKAALARRLRDPATRCATKAYPSIITARRVAIEARSSSSTAGRTLAKISATQAKEPFDAICDLLLAELETGDVHGLMVLAFAYRAFAHPECMVGSDATALALDGLWRIV